MRPDGINRIISYLDVVNRKNGELPTQIRADIIENLSAIFKLKNTNHLDIVLAEDREDITSRTRPIYVIKESYNQLTIVLVKGVMTGYTSEELCAILVHDLIHNRCITTLDTRVVSAYYQILEKFYPEMEGEADVYEIRNMMYRDFASRPFNNFILNNDDSTMLSGDELLIQYNLDKAWNNAMYRFHDISKDLWSAMKAVDFEDFNKRNIQSTLDKDTDFAKRVALLAKNRELNQWIAEQAKVYIAFGIKMNGSHRLSQDKFTSGDSMESNEDCSAKSCVAMNEGAIMKTKFDTADLRYQMDRVIVSSNYIDTEDERTYVLMKIKRLTNALNDIDKDLAKDIQRESISKESQEKQKYVQSYLRELDRIRETVVTRPMIPKKYGIFIEYPAGYEG